VGLPGPLEEEFDETCALDKIGAVRAPEWQFGMRGMPVFHLKFRLPGIEARQIHRLMIGSVDDYQS
jgi:hypothetical protein